MLSPNIEDLQSPKRGEFDVHLILDWGTYGTLSSTHTSSSVRVDGMAADGIDNAQ